MVIVSMLIQMIPPVVSSVHVTQAGRELAVAVGYYFFFAIKPIIFTLVSSRRKVATLRGNFWKDVFLLFQKCFVPLNLCTGMNVKYFYHITLSLQPNKLVKI